VRTTESQKTVVSHLKFRQSYSSGHLPYHCSFYYSARALMHDMACKFVCSKDAQKQLAQMSLNARALHHEDNMLLIKPYTRIRLSARSGHPNCAIGPAQMSNL